MVTMVSTTGTPFIQMKNELIQMEQAIKHGKLKEQQKRDEAVQKVESMVEEVRGTVLEFEIPEKPINKHNVSTALTHIALKGKSMLIVALQDLGTALKNKRDEMALRIINKIKRNEMYQKASKRVESWWLAGLRPFENKKKHKVM